MQATELCTYVLSIDDYGQVKSVGVNEGGLHMDIHIGFRPFPEHVQPHAQVGVHHVLCET
jgi:hypothetical protein